MAKRSQPKKQKNVPPTFEGLGRVYVELFNSLFHKSDRDAALSSAAYLDDLLNAMCRRLLNDEGDPDGPFIKKLMSYNGPLGSFSQRIDMAYALGWIGPGTRNDLHRIREVRNTFAHHFRIESFDHPDIKSECAQLGECGYSVRNPSVKMQFIVFALIMASQLTLATAELERPAEGRDLKG